MPNRGGAVKKMNAHLLSDPKTASKMGGSWAQGLREAQVYGELRGTHQSIHPGLHLSRYVYTQWG